MKNYLKPYFGLFSIIALSLGSSFYSSAHTYFFGLTELNINPHNQQLEVIHQYTAHDVENLIAQQQNITFSPEHSDYEKLIKNYFEQHFQLSYQGKQIPLNWIGIEVVRGQLYIYQENQEQSFLLNLTVKDNLLVETYSKQVNTVNYQSNKISGSLTFDVNHQTALITKNN